MRNTGQLPWDSKPRKESTLSSLSSFRTEIRKQIRPSTASGSIDSGSIQSNRGLGSNVGNKQVPSWDNLKFAVSVSNPVDSGGKGLVESSANGPRLSSDILRVKNKETGFGWEPLRKNKMEEASASLKANASGLMATSNGNQQVLSIRSMLASGSTGKMLNPNGLLSGDKKSETQSPFETGGTLGSTSRIPGGLSSDFLGSFYPRRPDFKRGTNHSRENNKKGQKEEEGILGSFKGTNRGLVDYNALFAKESVVASLTNKREKVETSFLRETNDKNDKVSSFSFYFTKNQRGPSYLWE